MKTNKTLTTLFSDGSDNIYCTFQNEKPSYYRVIEYENYFLVSLYSGDKRKYYKNEIKIEHINCVTGEVRDITDNHKYTINLI